MKQEQTTQSANEIDLTKITIAERNKIVVDSLLANEFTIHNSENTDNMSYFLRFKTTLKPGTWYFQRKYELLQGTAAGNTAVTHIAKSDWSTTYLRLQSNTKGSFTLTEDTSVFITCGLQENTGTMQETKKIRYYDIMLSQTDVAYTPFVADSPSLNYPAEIEIVKDSVEITISNKNILDIEKNTRINYAGLDISTDGDGTLNINGKSSGQMYLKIYSNLIEAGVTSNALKWDKKLLKKGTYTVSISNVSGASDLANVGFYIRNNASGGNTYAQLTNIANTKEQSKTFTLNKDTEIIAYIWQNTGTTFTNFKCKIFLERGDTATEYNKYEEQIKTLDIQQEMLENDKFEYDETAKKWYEVHNFSKVSSLNNNTLTVSKNNSNIDDFSRYRTLFWEFE